MHGNDWNESRSFSFSLLPLKTKGSSLHARNEKYLQNLLIHPHKQKYTESEEMNIKEAVAEHAAQCSSPGNIDVQ